VTGQVPWPAPSCPRLATVEHRGTELSTERVQGSQIESQNLILWSRFKTVFYTQVTTRIYKIESKPSILEPTEVCWTTCSLKSTVCTCSSACAQKRSLIVPVCPRNRKDEIGPFGSFMPARLRWMASATAVTASSWPTMRRCSSSDRCNTCVCVCA